MLTGLSLRARQDKALQQRLDLNNTQTSTTRSDWRYLRNQAPTEQHTHYSRQITDSANQEILVTRKLQFTIHIISTMTITWHSNIFLLCSCERPHPPTPMCSHQMHTCIPTSIHHHHKRKGSTTTKPLRPTHILRVENMPLLGIEPVPPSPRQMSHAIDLRQLSHPTTQNTFLQNDMTVT